MDEFDEVQPEPSYFSEEQRKNVQMRILSDKNRDSNIAIILDNLQLLHAKTRHLNKFLFLFDKNKALQQIHKLTSEDLEQFVQKLRELMNQTKDLKTITELDRPLIRSMHSILSNHLRGGTKRRKSRKAQRVRGNRTRRR